MEAEDRSLRSRPRVVGGYSINARGISPLNGLRSRTINVSWLDARAQTDGHS